VQVRKQLDFNIYKGVKGGRRPGAGRRRLHSKGVAHRQREKVKVSTPLHINFKLKLWVRNKDGIRLLKRAIRNAQSHGLAISHFSLQSNHVHLIVEAPIGALSLTCAEKPARNQACCSLCIVQSAKAHWIEKGAYE
jgi:hypothetical protein